MISRWIALFFFVGLVAGLGTSGLVTFFSKESVDLVGRESEAGAPGGREKDLLARIALQEEEISSLRLELEKTRDQLAVSKEAPPQQTQSEEERRDEMRKRFEARMEHRIDSRIEDMVTRFGLDESQRNSLREIYMKRMEIQRARRNGEDVERFDMDAAISGVMTEEQFAAYLDETQEDIYNRAELVATAQTVRLSQIMDLSSEAEDMIYETLNVTTQEMMIAQQQGEDFDTRQVIKDRLGSFLSEEQMQVVNENIRLPGGGWGRGGPRP